MAARSITRTLCDMVNAERNPRVLAIEWTKCIGDTLSSIRWHFGVSMSVTEPTQTPDGRANHTWRKRRPDELPENDPAQWARLAERARLIRYSANELEIFALDQQAKAEERLKEGA